MLYVIFYKLLIINWLPRVKKKHHTYYYIDKKNMETKHMTKDEFIARLKDAVKRYKESQKNKKD